MSVLILDQRIFPAIADKMWEATTNTRMDINYIGMMTNSRYEWDKVKIAAVVSDWCDMNERSYDTRYGEKPQHLKDDLRFRFKGGTPNTYQFLKWLQCIRYNIEEDHIEMSDQNKVSLHLLDTLIESAADSIVSATDEYKAAKWSDFKP